MQIFKKKAFFNMYRCTIYLCHTKNNYRLHLYLLCTNNNIKLKIFCHYLCVDYE